jgi:hypothetical protein
MAGFDVVAGGPIADIPTEGGAIVFAPATPELTLTAPAADVHGGASALPSAAVLTLTAPVASINAGVRIDAPAAVVLLTAPVAGISISARVAAPVASLTVTAPAAFETSGASQFPPAAGVTVTAPAALAAAGKSVFAPANAITLAAPTAIVAISARIYPPAALLNLAAPVARALAGNYIDASNSVIIEADGGTVAGEPVATFPVADGDLDFVTIKVPPTLVLLAPVAAVYAGKAVFPPSAALTLTSPAAEIRARRRKLRLMAIAS